MFTETTGEGLQRMSSAGGKVEPLTKLAAGEGTHRWPQVLPGGKAVLWRQRRAVDAQIPGAAQRERRRSQVDAHLLTRQAAQLAEPGHRRAERSERLRTGFTDPIGRRQDRIAAGDASSLSHGVNGKRF